RSARKDRKRDGRLFHPRSAWPGLMIARVAIGFITTAGVALWWSGLLSSNTHTYALPASEVHHRLEQAGLPPLVFGEEEPEAALSSTANQIVWQVQKDDAEVMRYTIDLTPIDASHTRVRVALSGPTQGKFGNVEQRLESDDTLKNLYLAAMKEQVDSALADHAFRYSAISGATAAATAA